MTEDTDEDAPDDPLDGDGPETFDPPTDDSGGADRDDSGPNQDNGGPDRDDSGSNRDDSAPDGDGGTAAASTEDADDPVEFDADTESEPIGLPETAEPAGTADDGDAGEDDSEVSEPDDGGPPGGGGDGGDGEGPDDEDDLGPGRPGDRARELRQEIHDLEQRLEEFESDVESRTVGRNQVERDLRRYVRRRMRRGHARGWGPYLVLLYGTIMTLGAFYSPYLTNGWTIGAMIVIWLSTLGLYVQLAIFGAIISVLSVPSRFYDRVGDWRS